MCSCTHHGVPLHQKLFREFHQNEHQNEHHLLRLNGNWLMPKDKAQSWGGRGLTGGQYHYWDQAECHKSMSRFWFLQNSSAGKTLHSRKTMKSGAKIVVTAGWISSFQLLQILGYPSRLNGCSPFLEIKAGLITHICPKPQTKHTGFSCSSRNVATAMNSGNIF